MRKWAAFFAWVGMGFGGAGTSACTSQYCTLVGCSDTEELRVSAPVTQVTETDVVACRNMRCWHGRLSEADLSGNSPSRGIVLQTDNSGLDTMTCVIDRSSKPGTALLQFSWSLSSSDPTAMGDALDATFSDSSGNTVLVASGTVSSFTLDYPNGQDCDKVGCKEAAVTGVTQ